MAMEKKKAVKKPIEQYDHKGKKRVNNSPVGLVPPGLDRERGVKAYAYDPHLDPQLQWSGKAELYNFSGKFRTTVCNPGLPGSNDTLKSLCGKNHGLKSIRR